MVSYETSEVICHLYVRNELLFTENVPFCQSSEILSEFSFRLKNAPCLTSLTPNTIVLQPNVTTKFKYTEWRMKSAAENWKYFKFESFLHTELWSDFKRLWNYCTSSWTMLFLSIFFTLNGKEQCKDSLNFSFCVKVQSHLLLFNGLSRAESSH